MIIKKEIIVWLCIALTAIIVWTFNVGLRVGNNKALRVIRTEAVESGVAEWVVDTKGEVTFRWKQIF